METNSYISLSLATAMQRNLDVTANNIANANTAGFKGERIAFEAYLTSTPGGEETEFVLDVGSFVDTRQGPLSETGNPLDIALNGPGWLSYRTAEGEIVYGRDGRLVIGPSGELQTLSGSQVLDSGGGAISVPPDIGELQISPDGTISSMAGPVAQIGVFDVPSIQSYLRDGAGMFRAPEGADTDIEVTTSTLVVQGAIEASNIQPVAEVIRLMDVQRAYQRANTLIDNEDRLLRDALQRLGRNG